MGSNFSRQMSCVPCGRCLKQEEANDETSETKPVPQISGGTSLCIGTPPPTPALQVSKQGSEKVQSLSQDAQPSADAVEESTETCSAVDAMGMTEGWEATWDSTGSLAALEDGETKEAEVLTQGTAESLIEKNLPPRAVQMVEEIDTYLSAEHVEEPEKTKLAEVSPQSAERAELPPLVEVETASLLPMQVARETVDALASPANGKAEMYSASAMPWGSLCPEGASLEPANQLLDFLEQETRSSMRTAEEMESLCCAEPVEQSEVLCLHEDENRECDTETAASEAEPQQQSFQQNQ